MTIKHLRLPKYDSSDGEKPAPDTFIDIKDELPKLSDPKAAAAYYKHGAEMLADALQNSLPGGLFHQLMIAMLERTQNIYRVKVE